MEKKRVLNTQTIAVVGLLTAVLIVLGETPLGLIPIGPIRATTLQIPVVIGAIIFGPVVGGLLGFFFGMISWIKQFTTPTITSFIFMNPLISVLPRIMIGLGTAWIYKLLQKALGKKNGVAPIALSAGIGSMINTGLVMGLIYLFYAAPYMESLGMTADKALGVIGGVIAVNGVAEMIVCALVSTPICYQMTKRLRRRV